MRVTSIDDSHSRSHIRPICLPRYPMNLVGRNAIISGWGKTTQKSFGQTGTNILQTASVPIISIININNNHNHN